MKVCETCGIAINAKDRENSCRECDSIEGGRSGQLKRVRKDSLKRERENVLESLGLKKVRGAMGGVYWE